MKVISRTTLSDYVLVENPKKSGQTCWLWTKYVDVSGDLSGLPVATPPPTPTPVIDFKLGIDQLKNCLGGGLNVKMLNNGEVAFSSAHLVVQDIDTGQSASTNTNSFSLSNTCIGAQPVDELPPGKTAYMDATVAAYDPSGHHMAAMVTLCSEPDMVGDCVSKEIKFTP